jgi:hypothetical protein
VLDQLVRLGLRNRLGGHDVAVGIELEGGLERLDLERPDQARRRKLRRRLAGERQRLRHLGRRLRTAGEDLVELVVVETRVGAHAGAVEGGGLHAPGAG